MLIYSKILLGFKMISKPTLFLVFIGYVYNFEDEFHLSYLTDIHQSDNKKR